MLEFLSITASKISGRQNSRNVSAAWNWEEEKKTIKSKNQICLFKITASTGQLNGS